MPVSCSPSDLVAESGCLLCLDRCQLSAIAIQLMCEAAMADCDPNTLLERACCIEACTTKGQREAIAIYLLAQIAGVSSDPAFLVEQACCLECLSGHQNDAVKVWLLCQIAD